MVEESYLSLCRQSESHCVQPRLQVLNVSFVPPALNLHIGLHAQEIEEGELDCTVHCVRCVHALSERGGGGGGGGGGD